MGEGAQLPNQALHRKTHTASVQSPGTLHQETTVHLWESQALYLGAFGALGSSLPGMGEPGGRKTERGPENSENNNNYCHYLWRRGPILKAFPGPPGV